MDADLPPFDRPLHAAVRTALADTPVVCLLGPRQAGKTTLARQFEPAYGYISLDDPATLAFAESDPAGFVAALPDLVILGEVQRAPELLRAIKLAVDQDRRPGRFLLTGSANLLLLPRLGDSLAGRMEVVDLQPLTAAEQARQPGAFLSQLLEDKLKPALVPAGDVAAPTLVPQVMAGGYPEAVQRPPTRARAWHRQYLRTLIERDVQDIARVRDTREVARLLGAVGAAHCAVAQHLQPGQRVGSAPRNGRKLSGHLRAAVSGAPPAAVASQPRQMPDQDAQGASGG